MTHEQETDLLQNAKNGAHDAFKRAHDYARNDGGERNKLAVEAATDHRERAEKLSDNYSSNGDVRSVIIGLREHRNHAERWETQFREWGGHDNLYAMHIHREAAIRYRELLKKIDEMNLEVSPTDKAAVTRLSLIFGNDGGCGGYFEEELTIVEGIETNVVVDEGLATEIWVRASASGNILAARCEAAGVAELAAKIRSAIGGTKRQTITRTRRIKVDLAQPCYFYQIETTMDLINGSSATLKGGYFSQATPVIQLM